MQTSKPRQTAKAKAALSADPGMPPQPKSKPLLDLVLASLDDDKAEEVVSIDLAGKTSIADFMVVANGRSSRQVAAMAEHLASRLKDAGYGTCPMEGLPTADWVLIDAGDIIVHLFRPEVRSFYNLEKMWSLTPHALEMAASPSPGQTPSQPKS